MKLTKCCKQPPVRWWNNENEAFDDICSMCRKVDPKVHKKEIMSGFSSSIVFDMIGKEKFDEFVKTYKKVKKERKKNRVDIKNNYDKML